MRLAPIVAAAAVVLSFAAPTLACRVRPVTPVVAQPPPGGEAARLLRAADEADAHARREELAARTSESRALGLERRADSLLERARFVRGAERSRLLTEAAGLENAAARADADADRSFQRAAVLRQQALDLRARAGG